MKRPGSAILSSDEHRYAVPVSEGFDLYQLHERGPMKRRYQYEGHVETEQEAIDWVEGAKDELHA